MYLAYETLSDGMKALLGGLVAVHAANVAAYLGDPTRKAREAEMAARVAEHPVVRTHSETGRKSPFIHAVSTTYFKGMTAAERRPLLSYLFRHALRPEFTCRFDRAVDSPAFWDNRCTQHRALNDYLGQRRVMHRVSIDGGRPAGLMKDIP
jgi:taurine dioxygenase